MITILLVTLSDREVEQAYAKSQGLCLPHFRLAGLRAEWEQLSFLAGHMSKVGGPLSTAKDGDSLEAVAGVDSNRRVRGCGQGQKAAPEKLAGQSDPAMFPARSHVLTLLAAPSCPVCAACEQGLREYFQWLASEMETAPSRSGPWDPSWHVCSLHLWDLQSAGYNRAAATIASRICSTWLSQLDDLIGRLAARQPDRLLARVAGLPSAWDRAWDAEGGAQYSFRFRRLWRATIATLESPDSALTRLRARFFPEERCQACAHVRETTHQTCDLILRGLEDPMIREAYHQAWGLCFRHCLAAMALTERPAILGEMLTALIARLSLLEWELNEATRKSNWVVRYEPKGPEETAWRRAAYQLCGSNLHGGTGFGL